MAVEHGGRLVSFEHSLPAASAISFGAEEAAVAATLYRSVDQARDREVDIAIAACAVTRSARIWTLNGADFADLPGVALY